MDGFIAVPILFLNRKVPHGTHFHRDTSRPILQQHSPFIITVNRHYIRTQLHDRINGAFPLLQRFFIRSGNGIHHLLHIFHVILHGIGHLNHRLLAVGHGHLYRCTDVDRHKRPEAPDRKTAATIALTRPVITAGSDIPLCFCFMPPYTPPCECSVSWGFCLRALGEIPMYFLKQ